MCLKISKQPPGGFDLVTHWPFYAARQNTKAQRNQIKVWLTPFYASASQLHRTDICKKCSGRLYLSWPLAWERLSAQHVTAACKRSDRN